MAWMSHPASRAAALLAITLILVLPGCDSDVDNSLGPIIPSEPPVYPEANEVLGGITLEGNNGSYSSDVPVAGSAPAPLVLGATQYVEGGSAVVLVTVEDTETQLIVGASSTESGYYSVDIPAVSKMDSGLADLPADVADAADGLMAKVASDRGVRASTLAANSFVMTVTPAEDGVRSSFTLLIASTDGTRNSAFARHNMFLNSTAAGSDWLQVSLNFVHPVDLDLHVETPEGADIYYGARTGPSGGQLDLDSNAACFIDAINNENITWLTQAPTAGTYTVRVNLWANCEQAGPFPYIVIVNNGGQSSLFTGEFTAAQAFGGGAHDGDVITTFTVSP